MRIFALSDLHVDFTANLEAVAALPSGPHRDDVLVLAGDLSHRLDRSEQVLRHLAACFARVFFVPGNHDLWVGADAPDDAGDEVGESSLDRLRALEQACAALGVRTAPADAGDGWWVVPLHGWYEPAFGRDGDSGEAVSPQWTDLQRCRWPANLADDGARSRHFAARNEAYPPPPPGRRVLTFSHFVPRPELIPPVSRLRFRQLPRVAGSVRIDAQARAAGTEVHVFGHSHIPWDERIDGVRYVQQPLAYPWERARRGQQGLELKRVV